VALRAIYTAASADAASAALDAFAAGIWGRRFPSIVKQWRQAWEHVLPFFAFPPDVPVTCRHPSLPVVTRRYLSLPVVTCRHLSSPVVTCRHL